MTLPLIKLNTRTDDYLTFKLSDKFVNSYSAKEIDLGWIDAGGNSLGELILIDKYSRLKPDGTKERWFEVCRRVIEGMYSIQKDWAKSNTLPWNGNKAQRSAEEAYDLLFNLYWTPPGRGLSSMGSYVVNGLKNSTPLQNCAFISTADMTKADPSMPFTFLMDVSMLGVGVGFDTKGAQKGFIIHEPSPYADFFTVPDSREGWVEALKLKLESYLIPNRNTLIVETHEIRKKGEPIKTFGGVAPGPEPLELLMERIDNLFAGRAGETLTEKDIADLGNFVGICVVSGNVRRSAEIILGDYNSKEFRNLKNYEVNPEREEWGWMSNNSVFAEQGQDYSDIVSNIQMNGEPGVVWMDNVKYNARIGQNDGIKDQFLDHRVAGVNPCAEQFLESGEMCTLASLHFSRIPNVEKLRRAIKYVFLYTKTVTLMPTHIAKTNAIMQRNRRIGVSAGGAADFMDNNGRSTLRSWLEDGYDTIRYYDHVYSEWLCVRESIRVTTEKPEGTLSLLVGDSAGAHWGLGGEYFMRAVTFDNDSPILEKFRQAGYKIEVYSYNPTTTSVVYMPVKSKSLRTERDVSIFEKVALAADLQHYWSDNGVSVTVSFDPATESKDIKTVLEMYDNRLKAISFLPMKPEGAYVQPPFGPLTSFEYAEWGGKLKKIDYAELYLSGKEAEGERGCTTDVCETR